MAQNKFKSLTAPTKGVVVKKEQRLAGDELLEVLGPQLAGVPPATVPVRDTKSVAPQTPEEPTKPIPFVLRLDPAVFNALDKEAQASGTTMTGLIALALQKAGYPVPETDLRDRRRRRNYSSLTKG